MIEGSFVESCKSMWEPMLAWSHSYSDCSFSNSFSDLFFLTKFFVLISWLGLSAHLFQEHGSRE